MKKLKLKTPKITFEKATEIMALGAFVLILFSIMSGSNKKQESPEDTHEYGGETDISHTPDNPPDNISNLEQSDVVPANPDSIE